jgi:hypothetical protein
MTRATLQRHVFDPAAIESAVESLTTESFIADPVTAELSDTRGLLQVQGPGIGMNPGDFFLADLRQQIADRAYLLAEARGFAPGHDFEDWLQAERDVLAAPH